MRMIPLIVLIMVTALLFSGLAGIDSGLSSGANTPVITYQSAAGSGYINYTIYSPQGTFYRSMMMNYLNESRIGTVSYGSLIQASVPVKIINSFTESMGILKKNFNISYFQDSKNMLFQPFSSPAQMEVPFAYTPSEIALAYGYNAAYSSGLNGKGETIAIVDAFGDPTIRYDVMAFDQIMNLPPINLSIIYPPGSGEIQQANASWALETATDVEWLGAELIFDLDADHMKGADTMTYVQILAEVKKHTIRRIDDFLMGDLGIQESEMKLFSPAGGVTMSTLSATRFTT